MRAPLPTMHTPKSVHPWGKSILGNPDLSCYVLSVGGRACWACSMEIPIPAALNAPATCSRQQSHIQPGTSFNSMKLGNEIYCTVALLLLVGACCVVNFVFVVARLSQTALSQIIMWPSQQSSVIICGRAVFTSVCHEKKEIMLKIDDAGTKPSSRQRMKTNRSFPWPADAKPAVSPGR
jgi:hypothetical protein